MIIPLDQLLQRRSRLLHSQEHHQSIDTNRCLLIGDMNICILKVKHNLVIQVLPEFLDDALPLRDEHEALEDLPLYSIPSIHLNRSIIIYYADHPGGYELPPRLLHPDDAHFLQVEEHAHHVLGGDGVLAEDLEKSDLEALPALVLNVL